MDTRMTARLILIAIVGCVVFAIANQAYAITCQTTCPGCNPVKICQTTCEGTDCIVACWDCQCYGDCSSGQSASMDGPSLSNLQTQLGICMKDVPVAKLAALYEERTGLAINIDPGLDETTLTGSWTGSAEDVFDRVMAASNLRKVKINSQRWRIVRAES